MKSIIRAAALCSGVLIATLLAAAASAEGFVDLYGGASFTDDADIDVKLLGESGEDTIDFDESATGGLRVGYWLSQVPWLGFAVDASFFAPEEPSVTMTTVVDGSVLQLTTATELYVFPVTPLVMARTKMLPIGRRLGIQPYVGVGPGIFVTTIDEVNDVQFDGESDSFDDVSVDTGIDARGGLNLHLNRWLTIFTEYRFTYFEPSYEDEIFGADLDIDAEILTHHIVGGIGFHF